MLVDDDRDDRDDRNDNDSNDCNTVLLHDNDEN